MNDPSGHLGFARKHRPQVFGEVVGQEAVSVTLRNSLAAAKPAHAYLFFGPRGVGKTTTARILAKALNCGEGISPDPCGQCASCREIAGSASVDVLELDAATHTQVDRIREMIIETVSLAPSRDRFKIFIIDEAHMLSTASFNALLKTLEEPPAHVVFILATTDPGKIPPTILSRCQRFRFRPAPQDLLEAHLKRIAESEKIVLEPEAARLLSQAAGGALRDGASLLEQAFVHAGGAVTAGTVRDLLGVLPERLLEDLARAVLGRDAGALAKSLEKVWEEGHDPAQLLRDLRERARLAYLYRLGVCGAPAPGWKSLADPHPPETFSLLIRRLNKALEDLRSADSQRLALELALFGMLESAYDFRDWIRRLEALEHRLGSGVPEEGDEAPAEAHRAREPEAEGSLAARPGPARLWAAVIEQLKEDKPGLADDLRQARLAASEGAPWRILFGREFDAERARRHQKELEAKLTTEGGCPIQLLFEVENAAVVRSGEEGGSPESAAEPEAAPDPAVEKVLKIFPGKVRVRKE